MNRKQFRATFAD